MAVHGPELVGRRFSSNREELISHSSVNIFADAIGSHDSAVPPTYLITFSVKAAEEFLPTLGFDWSRVVHGEQRFLHVSEYQVGDVLKSTSEIESYKSMAGNEFVTIRTDFSNKATNQLVSSTWATLVFRGEQS